MMTNDTMCAFISAIGTVFMKVISLNTNGIRSAIKKGFYEWVSEYSPDVICIQETKAQLAELQDTLKLDEYFLAFEDAQKKGYSGVAIFAKRAPDEIRQGFGPGFEDMDSEGRFVAMRFGTIWIASVYLPSGSSSEDRQVIKMSCLARLRPLMQSFISSGDEYILCGDFNIAHKNIDIKNWKGNQKSSGFLPEERAWIDQILQDGWVDGFRVMNQEAEQYSWWSNRGQAYAKNVGWRIDYHFVTPNLREKIKEVFIFKAIKFSDHAPVVIEYDL